MDRPENGILIVPRVDRLENNTFVVLVRRLTFVNSLIVSKELLTPDGEWVNVPEGGKYPKECFLKSQYLDRHPVNHPEYNWPPIGRPYKRVNLGRQRVEFVKRIGHLQE